MGSELQFKGAGMHLQRAGTPVGSVRTNGTCSNRPAFSADPISASEAVRAAKQDHDMNQSTYWTTPGFGPMTRISTNFGAVPAQALRVRDMVRTDSGAYLPIVWLDRILLSEGFMSRHPEAMPVEMQAGAFGQGLPAQSIQLSPGQGLCPGADPSLMPNQEARELLDRPGTSRRPESIFTYTLFHLGQPAHVHCEGLWVHVCPQKQARLAA